MPMPSIIEVEEPRSKEDEQKIQQHLMDQLIPQPPTLRQSKARKMNGMWIGSKHNHAKVVSQKQITKIINAQAEKDQMTLLTTSKQKVTYKTPKLH